jgi:hypothetical protein
MQLGDIPMSHAQIFDDGGEIAFGLRVSSSVQGDRGLAKIGKCGDSEREHTNKK